MSFVVVHFLQSRSTKNELQVTHNLFTSIIVHFQVKKGHAIAHLFRHLDHFVLVRLNDKVNEKCVDF